MTDYVRSLRRNDKKTLFALIDACSAEDIDMILLNLQRTPDYLSGLTMLFDNKCTLSFHQGREQLKSKKDELKRHLEFIVDYRGTDTIVVNNMKLAFGAATVSLHSIYGK